MKYLDEESSFRDHLEAKLEKRNEMQAKRSMNGACPSYLGSIARWMPMTALVQTRLGATTQAVTLRECIRTLKISKRECMYRVTC